MTSLEKIFSVVGIIGFGFLLPGILSALGYQDFAQFCQINLGALGNLSVMTVVGFILIGLAIFFGGGENITATLLGLIIGFFLISTAVTVDFMQWFADFAKGIPFLNNPTLNYFCGIATVMLGLGLSFFQKVKITPQLIILIGLPLGFLATSNAYGMFQFEQGFQLSMNEGMSQLSSIIDEKYQSMPAVKKYIDDLLADEELSEEEKKEQMEKLQGRIEKQEDDRSTLAKLKEENERYKKLLASQEEALKNVNWCESAKDTSNKVKTFEEAVKPQQPCVRDFAVSLAKEYQGAYYGSSRGLPGAEGIKQVAAIHVHLSTNWKYVSDPIAVYRDFYSPADRTLALGLAGDCDDFSIIMASAIEAVGGKSRIMGGQCAGGGHAWAEVFIGGEDEWKIAVSRLKDFYRNQSMDIQYSRDEQGGYWLPLDWRIGNFTCNDYDTEQIYDMNQRMVLQAKNEMMGR